MNDQVHANHSGLTAHEGAQTSRPTPPDGMTYNRKGALVKKRVQQGRSNKVFLVLQIVDDNGSPTDFTKRNVKILGVMRNSDKVLEMLEGGEHEGAFYIRHDFSAK